MSINAASSFDDTLIITQSLDTVTTDADALGEILRATTFAAQERGVIESFRLRPDAKRWGEVKLSAELMDHFEIEDLPAWGDGYRAGGCTYTAGHLLIEALWWRDNETVLFFRVRRGNVVLREVMNFDSARQDGWFNLPRVVGH